MGCPLWLKNALGEMMQYMAELLNVPQYSSPLNRPKVRSHSSINLDTTLLFDRVDHE
jgi:hypothetical protein